MSLPAAEALRRSDWRFLLANRDEPFGRAAFCGASEQVRAMSQQAGLADVVQADVGDGELDLLACSVTNSTDVHALASALVPGGVLCCEVDRRRGVLLTPNKLTQKLASVGLQVRGIWAVRPGFDRVESFVPVDESGPLPWFLRTQYRARRPIQQLAAQAIRLLVREDGRRFAAWTPFYIVVAERSSVQRDAGAGAAMILTDSGNRVARLQFPAGADRPSDVIKIPKLASLADRTRHEHVSLTTVRAALPDDLTKGMPRPVGLIPWGPVDASRESVVEGVSLAQRTRHGRRHRGVARRDLIDAADWLTSLHLATRAAVGPGHRTIADEITAQLTEYRERFGDSAATALASVEAALDSLDPIPWVTCHRDFNVWNIIRDDDLIAVIDWEGVRPGPPLCDLIHLCVHWHEIVSRRRPRMPDPDGLRRVFVEQRRETWCDAAVAGVIDAYVSALSLPEAWIPVLVATTWIELALRRDRQQTDAGTNRDDAGADNIGVRYVEALANSDVRWQTQG